MPTNNHPNRNWRAFARLAADIWIGRERWDKGGGAHVLTPDQMEQSLQDAFLAGCEYMRAEIQRPDARRNPLTDKAVAEARARIEAGETADLREIAVRLGLDVSTVARACKRAGLQLPRGRPRNAAATTPAAGA